MCCAAKALVPVIQEHLRAYNFADIKKNNRINRK
jgi:hypothetical protein